MDAKEEGQAVRKLAASRYGLWVAQQMRVRDWSAAMLARRSGIKKQTVGAILRGEAVQPTAWQVASIAKAFGTEPNEIFEVAGLWSGFDGSEVPPEMAELYRSLDHPARRAMLGVGRVIREMQEEYATTQEPSEDDSEPDEPPSLHPPGTMGEIYNPAAYGGEDLRRAENRRRYDEEQRRKREAEADDP